MSQPVVSVPVKLTAKCPFCDELAVVEIVAGRPAVTERCHHALIRPDPVDKRLYVLFADDGES